MSIKTVSKDVVVPSIFRQFQVLEKAIPTELIGKSIVNHQKYEIAFKKLNDTFVVCNLSKDDIVFTDIPLVFAKNFKKAQINPYNLTFDSINHTVVVSHYGLNGGMHEPENEDKLMALLEMRDSALAGVVAERLPVGTYSVVNVRTLSYNFSGMIVEGTETRLISLTVTKTATCASFFKAMLAGFGFLDESRFGSIDTPKLEKELLQHICNARQESDAIEMAYEQCTDIDLYISQDAKSIEMKIRKSNLIIATFKGAKVVSHFAPIVFALVIKK
ncbi:MAG: hypothetical protein KBA81_07290 [Rhabdochlamydiaceae bacterium]|nr:hypothetical protein [Rhabdochlamydiaceae bacterium]